MHNIANGLQQDIQMLENPPDRLRVVKYVKRKANRALATINATVRAVPVQLNIPLVPFQLLTALIQ